MAWYMYLLGALYIGINVLLVMTIWRFMNAVGGFLGKLPVKIVITVIYALAASTVVIWTLFENPYLVFYTKKANNVWIGIFIFMLIYVAVAEIVSLILLICKKMNRKHPKYRRFTIIKGCAVVAVVAGMTIVGTIGAENVYVTEYDMVSDKTCEYGDELTIALVADQHIGYTVGKELMGKMVDVINEQDADLVLFGGDIIDNDYYAMKDDEEIEKEFKSIKSKLGVYGVYGNHDVLEKLVGGFSVSDEIEAYVQNEVDQFLIDSGIQIMEDEVIEIAPGIDLIGRVDESKPNISDNARMSIEELVAEADQDHFIIDLDHEPSELQEKAYAGVDLDLGGHTHNGQIFPGTLTIHLFWDNACGMKFIDDMVSVVTSGVGVWGPAMRVGAKSEVAVVHVHFAN